MQQACPSVSVLVPIYNVERYLPQCLEALCSQTLRDLEIVAVNDGSTDGSLSVLQEWARKDERIVIVDKPNSGYGASMNCGIEAALRRQAEFGVRRFYELRHRGRTSSTSRIRGTALL